MRTLIVQKDGRFESDPSPARLPEMLAAPGSVVWLDVSEADESDVGLLRDAFHFHPLAIEDATRAHERPKVDIYMAPNGPTGSYYFVVFYQAELHEGEDYVDVEPLNLFIGKNYLVTVHRDAMSHVKETRARWQAADSPLGNSIGALVHDLLDSVVDSYFPLMDRVADRVEDLEDTIFVRFDQASIHAIFHLKKGLLSMRRVVAPERDVLNVLLRRELPVFTDRDVTYLQDVYDHLVRVTDNIDTYRDLLSSALDSYLSVQSNNLNQIMKTLTMASIILMSNALIAGIYGMNFRFIPELGWGFGYGWALSLMLIVSAALLVYYRHMKWF